MEGGRLRGIARRPIVIVAGLVIASVIGAVFWISTQPGVGRADPSPTGSDPSPTDLPSGGAASLPPSAAPGGPLSDLVANPVVSPQPDAAQQELIDAGGTFHVSLRGGFSVVAPDSWDAGTFGEDADRELRDLAARVDRPSVGTVVEQLESGAVEFAAFDLPPGASRDDVATAVTIWRWSRYSGQPVDQLADLLLERDGASEVVRDPVALPSGEAIRLSW
jgi:hypothetical protein